MLADHEIEQAVQDGEILIDPRFAPERLQPASVDLLLGNEFMTYARGTRIDPRLPSATMIHTDVALPGDPFILSPGRFVLATTIEEIGLSDEIAARIEGKSSIARMGVIVHSTAGFIDPGFLGQLTLEMTNFNNIPVVLWPGMPICQVSFTRITKCRRPYGHEELGSKYQAQKGVTPTRSYKSWSVPFAP